MPVWFSAAFVLRPQMCTHHVLVMTAPWQYGNSQTRQKWVYSKTNSYWKGQVCSFSLKITQMNIGTLSSGLRNTSTFHKCLMLLCFKYIVAVPQKHTTADCRVRHALTYQKCRLVQTMADANVPDCLRDVMQKVIHIHMSCIIGT